MKTTMVLLAWTLFFVSFISCLKVSIVCNLAVPQVCSLKYNLNKLEKHQIENGLNNWHGSLDTSITDASFIVEFRAHPLIKLFINKQLKLLSLNKKETAKKGIVKDLHIFTVQDLKSLKVNNHDL